MTENESKYGKIAIVGVGRCSGKTAVIQLEIFEELQAYRAIGTVEEFKILKEKNVAKKVKGKHMSDSLEERQLCGEYTLYGYCPNCGESITNLWNSVNCGDCGQRLDWK